MDQPVTQTRTTQYRSGSAVTTILQSTTNSLNHTDPGGQMGITVRHQDGGSIIELADAVPVFRIGILHICLIVFIALILYVTGIPFTSERLNDIPVTP